MSGSELGAGDKRQREHPAGEEAVLHPQQPPPQQSPHVWLSSPSALPILVLFKSLQASLVSLQLLGGQGAAPSPFVHAPPPARNTFSGVQEHGASLALAHAERLRAVSCGLQARMVRLLLLGTASAFEQRAKSKISRKLMYVTLRRVFAGLFAAAGLKVAKEAEALCALGRSASAVAPLDVAICCGHLPSHALKAWMLIHGREGLTQDWEQAFKLAGEGARMGCHHCQGVLALCYWGGYGCATSKARALELAAQSSGKGSRYGHFTLGWLRRLGQGGLMRDNAEAFNFFRMASDQNLDGAQYVLGDMHLKGIGTTQDYTESLRMRRLSAAQGHPAALYKIASLYEYGKGVARDKAEAVRLYRRAAAAGHHYTSEALERLGECPSAVGSEGPARPGF